MNQLYNDTLDILKPYSVASYLEMYAEEDVIKLSEQYLSPHRQVILRGYDQCLKLLYQHLGWTGSMLIAPVIEEDRRKLYKILCEFLNQH